MDTWVASTFWLLWIMLLWTWVCKYLFEILSFGYIPRRGITGSYGNSVFSFLRNHHTIFHRGCTILCSYQQGTRVPITPHPHQHLWFSVFFFFFNLLIFGCVGSSFLCEGFLQLRQVGATLHRGARASHYRGLSCCGAQAPGAQAQQLWLTGPVAPRHVGSSQTRARTRVPCMGRQILNHCATREALCFVFLMVAILMSVSDMSLWSWFAFS